MEKPKIGININKKYLPSKKFTYSILIFLGVIILIYAISTLLFGKSSFLRGDKGKNLATQKLTLNELLQKDSDGDGIMDWEEGLWGTDPNNTRTFDMPDAEYIKNKRDILKTTAENQQEGGSNTETDKFAQQFFASLAALKQSGQLDNNTLKNMSTSLGEKIANPTIIDNYTEGNLKVNPDSSIKNQEDYYLKIASLFETYQKKGIGEELDIVGSIAATGASASSPEMEQKLNSIANYYQEYAQKMLQIFVPKNLSSYHLDIINNSNNTGIAVRNMAKVSLDPIVGLSGVAQYQKYSDSFVKSVENLENILLINGILE